MNEVLNLTAQVSDELDEQRLDQVAAVLFPEYSRSKLQAWIKSGHLLVDGQVLRPREKLVVGQCLTLQAEVETQENHSAEDIPLDIVFEDEHLLVINKPTGLVVHPGAGNPSGTMLNALLHYLPEQASLTRAGIVHRLDKDTTGIMVVAKSELAHTSLVAQLQDRSISREYEAVTRNVMRAGGTVNAPMGRHPKDRKKMAVLQFGGKPAVTHYRVLHRFAHHTHIRVNLETGRTHQIRVHMAHINYPLVGDVVYGGRARIPPHADQELIDGLQQFPRQALHARKLTLIHPATKAQVEWAVPLPDDFNELLYLLTEYDN